VRIMRYQRLKNFQGRAIVLAFDICSSSDIIEDLTTKNDIPRYQQLLGGIEHYLAKAQRKVSFDPYKFTGDGWILIFPEKSTNGRALLHLMRDLSVCFRSEFKKLAKHLDTLPDITGINFGADVGEIWHMKIYGTDEYIGRPSTLLVGSKPLSRTRTARPHTRLW
jgi:hypothetical protein